ncbi:MAG TPA: hypothetical protein VJS43_19055, partial [Candidatus Acidoferrales bacterium]|nr:hypothetical protein [Candidatus Acidoferrales bacterium]
CDGKAILPYASSSCDRLARRCVRHLLCWPAFPLVPALRSTGSAAFAPVDASAVGSFALFAGFIAVGSEEARSIALALASVRRPNWTCSFPASSFHEDAVL